MSTYTKSWLTAITDQFQAMMQKHDMPEDIAIEIERFLIETVREQFRAGSRSGAAWQRDLIYKKGNKQQSMGLSGALPA